MVQRVVQCLAEQLAHAGDGMLPAGHRQPALVEQGSGDTLVQAYNFRICLTDNPDNMIPITRPENYDAARYELLARLFEAQPGREGLNDYFIWSMMPNRKTDINNRGGFSTDMINMNHAYPEASWEEREQIIKEHEDYTKGLLYFYVSDPRVPEVLQKEVSKWGYPKDEYPGKKTNKRCMKKFRLFQLLFFNQQLFVSQLIKVRFFHIRIFIDFLSIK